VPERQQERIINPYAPPAYNGMVDAAPEGWVDVPFSTPFDVDLTAGSSFQTWRGMFQPDRFHLAGGRLAVSANRRVLGALRRLARLLFQTASFIAATCRPRDRAGALWSQVVIPGGGQIGITFRI